MLKNLLLIALTFSFLNSFSQVRLISWSQQNIENYTREMYDAAQKLTTADLLTKNLNDKGWSDVFLTMNASVNNYAKDTLYLKALAEQITNTQETKLTGTSRLIIWDRIITGDILFEGKGIVFFNDLFRVSGRANQLLQTLTGKNFGSVTLKSTNKELSDLKSSWQSFLENKSTTEYKGVIYKNAKIPEVSSLTAIQAMIGSLSDSPWKQKLTKDCLKNLYKLDEMPKDKGAPANFCNPDTYTYSYLGMLFEEKDITELKDAKLWQRFWEKNKDELVWNDETGKYNIKGL